MILQNQNLGFFVPFNLKYSVLGKCLTRCETLPTFLNFFSYFTGQGASWTTCKYHFSS